MPSSSGGSAAARASRDAPSPFGAAVIDGAELIIGDARVAGGVECTTGNTGSNDGAAWSASDLAQTTVALVGASAERRGGFGLVF
jgi:hypothetical protein